MAALSSLAVRAHGMYPRAFAVIDVEHRQHFEQSKQHTAAATAIIPDAAGQRHGQQLQPLLTPSVHQLYVYLWRAVWQSVRESASERGRKVLGPGGGHSHTEVTQGRRSNRLAMLNSL